MHRLSKNCAVYLVSVSLLRGWELNLVIIVEVKVSTGEEKVIIIIVKKFIVGIRALKLNLFGLIAHVSRPRVCRQELKLIATCLIIL